MRKPFINNYRREGVLSLIGCIVFVAMGVWMVAVGRRFGWVAILFFGAGIPLFIWQIVHSRPGWMMVGRGVAGRRPGGGMTAPAEGKSAGFTFDVDEADESATEAARNTVKFVKANEPLIRHKVAASMIELYKEWNDGDTITAEELARRITLTGVTVWDEGGGELFYTADDLFAGHWICAYIDANGEIDEPGLEG